MALHPKLPDLQPGALIAAALTLLILPLRWILAMILGGIVHECFHILALQLQCIKIHRIRIGPSGALIFTAPMDSLQELLSAAAGPVGSFLLLFFLPCFPELALCGLAQGLYNLLPLYPADGGRILCSLAALWFPAHAATAARYARGVTHIFLTACAVTLVILFTRWFWVILTGLLLILKPGFGKIPCKEEPFALQ